jgi:hypothetical protein
LIAVLSQRVPEPAAGELPLRLRLVHQVRESDAAPQRLVDARAARQQGLAVDPRGTIGIPLAGPGDAAERKLQADDQVQRASDDGPHALEEHPVMPDPPVVQHADGDVGRHVRLGAGVLDLSADDPHGPGTVRSLGVSAPVERQGSSIQLAAHHESHRALDVVPRVGVLAGRPRDRPVRLLHRGDAGGGRGNLFRGQHGVGLFWGHAARSSGLRR